MKLTLALDDILRGKGIEGCHHPCKSFGPCRCPHSFVSPWQSQVTEKRKDRLSDDLIELSVLEDRLELGIL